MCMRPSRRCRLLWLGWERKERPRSLTRRYARLGDHALANPPSAYFTALLYPRDTTIQLEGERLRAMGESTGDLRS